MAKNITTLLNELGTEFQSLEERNKTLEKEIGEVRLQNITLEQENAELKRQLSMWKK